MNSITTSAYDVTPLSLSAILFVLGMGALLVVMTTSYVKIVVVLGILRNALGMPQTPSNIVINGLSIGLSLFVMAPVVSQMDSMIRGNEVSVKSLPETIESIQKLSRPLLDFVERNTRVESKEYFADLKEDRTQRLGLAGGPVASPIPLESGELPWSYALPAFLLSELKEAFRVGMVLFLPFVIIDIIVANVLIALGMMMMSPNTIALPLKLLLFVVIDGWSELVNILVMSYV